LATFLTHTVHDTDNIGRGHWFKGQRSASDGRRNLVNAIAPEPLKVFEPKLHKYFI